MIGSFAVKLRQVQSRAVCSTKYVPVTWKQQAACQALGIASTANASIGNSSPNTTSRPALDAGSTTQNASFDLTDSDSHIFVTVPLGRKLTCSRRGRRRLLNLNQSSPTLPPIDHDCASDDRSDVGTQTNSSSDCPASPAGSTDCRPEH